jgi:hypothetical protein
MSATFEFAYGISLEKIIPEAGATIFMGHHQLFIVNF